MNSSGEFGVAVETAIAMRVGSDGVQNMTPFTVTVPRFDQVLPTTFGPTFTLSRRILRVFIFV